jgi:Na+-driven multidrug efflux pump
MIGITTGGILNVLLDPLFIFIFQMGIAGAAVATALSQLTSFCILLSYFVLHKTTTKLGIHRLSKRPMVYYQIVKNGMPSFSRQGLASIASILLNQQAAIYGDAAVAAMAIVTKIFMMIFSVMIGFGQGYQPVVGFNYGAGIMDRVKKAMKFTLVVGMIGMSCAAAILFMVAPALMKLFISDDPVVLEIGTMTLRAQAISMPLIPIGTVANMTFQSVGKAWHATIMSAMRQGIFFIPLIFILPAMFQLWGVVATQAVSDMLTAFACMPFLWHFYKNLEEDGKIEK